MDAGAAEYSWLQNDPRLDAFCVTAVTDRAREEVLAAFGADPGTETSSTFEEAFNGMPSPSYVVLGEVPGGILVAENNGWRGTLDEVITAVSRGTTAASYYRNVNAVMAFFHAVDGAVASTFDPLLDEVPAELSELASELDFATATEASAFALLERLTGIRLTEEWLEATHSRFDVPSGF
jgi:hypothetical protein